MTDFDEQQREPMKAQADDARPFLIFAARVVDEKTTVSVFRDRIEWTRPRNKTDVKPAGGLLARFSGGKRVTETIPVTSMTSVTTSPDGFLKAKVSLIASGISVDFRMSRVEGARVKSVFEALILGTEQAAEPQAGELSTSKLERFKPTLTTGILGSLVAFFALMYAIVGGFPAILVILGMAGLVTAVYVSVTGRRTGAPIPARKTAAIALVASLALFISGGVAAAATGAGETRVAEQPAARAQPSATRPATPTPTTTPGPEFSEAAPVDPASVTQPTEDASVVAVDTSVTDTTALALLATLPVKGKAAKTGYDRTGMFGTAWIDIDRNGCDTRNDILARDLTAITKSGSCRVLTGDLVSPFTAASISFVRGQDTSAFVQIDHVVALSNAWQTGAQQLTQAQRVSLANDPINLLAVDGSSNAQKGDGDTATWLPSNKEFRCGYVARQISVKATYGLWVTQAEYDAMARILGSCPDELALTSSFAAAPVPVVVVAPVAPAPAPAPEPAPAPAPEPAPAPVAVYYANCDAVRAAGAAPLYEGQPGYSSKLDRDKDGIGCDT